jgi:tRNA 2-thiouridine synthesizing protein A
MIPESAMKADRVLDCYGLLCPMPVRKTEEAMRALAEGEVLQVIATDEWFGPDLEAWLRDQPHELLSVGQQNGEVHAYIVRRSTAAPDKI